MTTLSVDVRIGSQRPRLCSSPPYFSSLGQDKIDLAEHAGLTLDPWQRYVIEETSGLNRSGKYAAFEVGLIVPRQNGKGAIIEADQLGALFLTKDPQIVYSAHQFKTAKAMYRRIRDLIKNTPDLHKLTGGKYDQFGLPTGGMYRYSNEETGIELTGVGKKSGPRLNFFARSDGSGRGFSGKKMYFDEAYDLSPGLIGDMLPTLSAMDSPQVWYISSAGKVASEQLAKVRSRGIKGGGRLAFFEWSAPEGSDLDDDEPLYEGNPGLGIRLDLEWIRDVERESMDDDEFGRERYGLWPGTGTPPVITSDLWKSITDPDSRRAGSRIVFGLEAETDREMASIAFAGLNAAGRIHLELTDPGQQVTIPEAGARLIEMHRRLKPHATVVIAASSPAMSILPTLKAARVDVEVLSAQQERSAAGALVDAITERSAVHTGRQFTLATSVALGKKHKTAAGWHWRDNPGTAPLRAATNAHYGFTLKHRPQTEHRERRAVVL